MDEVPPGVILQELAPDDAHVSVDDCPTVMVVGFAVKVADGGGTVARLALQVAVVPPFDPRHDHVHGPVPVTVVGVPVLQRFSVGPDDTVVPFAEPQVPFTGRRMMVTVVLCVVEPPAPVQVTL